MLQYDELYSTDVSKVEATRDIDKSATKMILQVKMLPIWIFLQIAATECGLPYAQNVDDDSDSFHSDFVHGG